MSPSIKKLATIFLLVAVVTSSSVWGIAFFSSREKAKSAAAEHDSRLPESAFRAPEQEGVSGAGQGGKNLTEDVTSLFARSLVERNPKGPQVLADGTINLFAPSLEGLESYLDENPPDPKILEPKLEENKIRSVSATKESITLYLSEISQIQERVSSDPMWQNAITSTSTDAVATEWISQSGNILAEARDDMYEMEVPLQFLEFHKSILAVMSTASTYSQVAASDPVGAVALAQDLGTMLDRQNAAVSGAQEKLLEDLPALLSHLPEEDRSIIARLFAVQVAHAQFAVIDPAHIAATVAQWAKWFAENYKRIALSLALGYLKTTLLRQLSQKVIEWAQGSDAPGFVTNWLVFQAQSGIAAAEDAVGGLSKALCGNAATNGVYGEVVASVLGSPSDPKPGGGGVGDRLDCPKRSERALFGQEGWDSFLGVTKDSIWTDLISVQGAGRAAARTASRAATNEAVAGQGFIDTQQCDDGSTPSRSGRCDDGSLAWTISLGSTKGDLTSKGLGAIFDLITGTNNEDMMTTLTSAVANAILSYVIDEAAGVFNVSRVGGPTGPPGGLSVEELLGRADNNTESAISAMKGAIRILQNAAQSCAENEAIQALDLADAFQETVEVFEGRLQEIRSLIASGDASEEAAENIMRQSAQDNEAATNAVAQANEFIQTCTPV